MQSFLTKGLTETASSWSDVEQGYTWVHRAAHILSNEEKLSAAQVRRDYEHLLSEMEQAPISSETLATMLSAFRPRDHKLLVWPLSLLRCGRSSTYQQRVRAVF